MQAIRAHVPALHSGIAFFDGPGGTQVPDVVADAVRATLVAPISNRGRTTESERYADAIAAAARAAVADLLAADPRGIVFGRSMTQLTFDFARTLAAEAAGATIRWRGFDRESTELTVEDVAEVLSDRTRVVALTGASNLVGTRPDLTAIAGVVHAAGALSSSTVCT